MGDNIQQQLSTLLRLFQEERDNSAAERAKINTRLDALTEHMASHDARDRSRDTGDHSKQSGASSEPQRGRTMEVDGSASASTVPKVAKLDFPKYRGVDDPIAWLSRCDHFFRHQQTPKEDMVGHHITWRVMLSYGFCS